jgi:uncharacterized protein (DUF736 family)
MSRIASKIPDPNRKGRIQSVKINPNGQVVPSTGQSGQNKPAFAYFGTSVVSALMG